MASRCQDLFELTMPAPIDLKESILDAWRTNNHANQFLVEQIPIELWQASIPGSPRRTVRTLGAHLHNSRCGWINTLGKPHGIAVPVRVDRYKVTPDDLVQALEQSGAGILSLLEFGCDRGGRIPPTRAYVWRNLPLDVGHVLGYFIAHEAHHRGQIVMLAKQLGCRLPREVVDGIWHWTRLSRSS